jgi:hypothetical protein
MKIEVTQDCIDAAKFLRDQSQDGTLCFSMRDICPIALATALAGFPDSSVGGEEIHFFGRFSENGYRRSVTFPDTIRNRTLSWDVSGEMAPFSFQYENGRISNVQDL